MHVRVLAKIARQHILATPQGTKKKSSSANMAEDNSQIDPRNIDNPEYNEIPEDQRQALEIKLKESQEEVDLMLWEDWTRCRSKGEIRPADSLIYSYDGCIC